MARTSLGVSSSSSALRFSAMCAGVEEPGITEQPLARAQANKTELTEIPRSCAMRATALPVRSEVAKRAPPSEL